MLKIALPNKGTFSEDAIQLIRDAGYHCRRDGRELMVRDTDNQVEFYFLRPRDIGVYVSNGMLDLGITGRDLLIESKSDAAELMPLRFGRAALCYATTKESPLTPDTLEGCRIATSFPHLVSLDLLRRNTNAEIVRLDGAVEISIALGVADVIADLVQTGKTLEDAGLKVIGSPILPTEAVLVARNEEVATREEIGRFIDRVKGIIVAREYVMVEYDCLKEQLEAACAITPGIESPTVAPLSKDHWVAVKSMARKKDINHIMDALTELGAKGIIVTDIRTCRI